MYMTHVCCSKKFSKRVLGQMKQILTQDQWHQSYPNKICHSTIMIVIHFNNILSLSFLIWTYQVKIKNAEIFGPWCKAENTTCKGGLISEGVLVPLPAEDSKSLPWAKNLNLPPIKVNKLFIFSAQRSDLAPFIGNGTKVKIHSEIKPPLFH